LCFAEFLEFFFFGRTMIMPEKTSLRARTYIKRLK